MSFGSIFKTMFGSDGRPQQQNANNMTPEEKAAEAKRLAANEDLSSSLARSLFQSAQDGTTDGSNLIGIGRAYSEGYAANADGQNNKAASALQSLLGVDPSQLPQKTAPQAQQMPAAAAPNTMQMIQPPSAPAMNITQPAGTKSGSYRPAQLSFSPGTPSMLANMGLVAPQTLPAFMVTQPTGTKPGNYKPTTMTMNAPRPVGPQAMAQIMEAMRLNGGATPFAPYGQG